MELKANTFTVRTKHQAKKHVGLAHHIAYRVYNSMPMLRKWGEYEDVLQEAVLALHVACGGGYDKSKAAFSTYATRIIYNHFVDCMARTHLIRVYRDCVQAFLNGGSSHKLSEKSQAKANSAIRMSQLKFFWDKETGEETNTPIESKVLAMDDPPPDETGEEEKRLVSIALGCLNDKDKKLVALKFGLLGYQEVSGANYYRAMGKSKQQLHDRLAKVRAIMREALAGHGVTYLEA